MHLKKDKKKNGRIYLSITESYRNDSGMPKNRTVKILGYLDDLEREWGEDALTRCKQICVEMTEEARKKKEPKVLQIYSDEELDLDTCRRKNAGIAVALSYYNMLGIESTIRNACRDLRLKFDCNAVARLLVADRLLDKSSKLCAWQNKDKWFFESKFSDDDLYRALDVLAGAKRSIISRMNKEIAKSGLRKINGNVFYDVTNYYFEIDEADSLRKKGVSKEHRPNPIVQMGLLQDSNALPITYKIFPGNTNDCATMIDVLSDMKHEFNLERIIAVADKGLNCSTNIAALYGKGDGFVFSQSIRGTKSPAELQKWAICEKGYIKKANGFKIKSRLANKTVTIKAQDSDDGKVHKIDIPVKQVAFWSEKYALLAEHKRSDAIAKAHELAKDPSKYDAAIHYGATKYLDGISIDEKTGEIVDTGKAIVFNEEKLEKERSLDGYYVIITSETEMADTDIVETYRGLWKIEETFKITKSELEARPVFVRTQDHIEAHFLICYIALVIIRIIQNALGFNYSAHAILDELSALSCSYAGSNMWLFDYRTSLTDKLFSLIGHKSPDKWMSTQEIKSLLNKSIKPVMEIG